MGQISGKLRVASCQLPVLTILLLTAISCRKHAESAAAANSRAKHPTVASLVPAATDLIVQMGLTEHLVGISNYDDAADLHLKNLPRVGDYQNVDWERLGEIRPDVMIIFESPQRLPAGLTEQANRLHIQLANVRTETINDIIAEARHLGMLLGEQTKSENQIANFKSRLEKVRKHTAGKPTVRTLLLLDPGGFGAVGRDNFLDDALKIAGGENVITARGWPNIDREKLEAMHPQIIVALLAENSPAAISSAENFFKVEAPPNCRTAIIAHWYAQQSSFSVADIAEELADVLHPRTATQNSLACMTIHISPVTTPSSGTPGEGRGGGNSSEVPFTDSVTITSRLPVSSAFSVQNSAFEKNPHPILPPEYKGRENYAHRTNGQSGGAS